MEYDFYKFFYPIVKEDNVYGKYEEYLADVNLRPYIRCYWSFTVDAHPQRIMPYEKCVIPDGCMDIIFYRNTVTNQCQTMFVGINDLPIYSTSTDQVEMFGIRFYLWAAHVFFNVKMSEMKNSSVSLDLLWTDADMLSELIFTCTHIEEKIKVAEIFLRKRLSLKSDMNIYLTNAMSLIVNCFGIISVEAVGKKIVLSSRQLERIFHYYVGLSPKATIQVIRFQNILRELNSRNRSERTWLDIVQKYGYFDQSHFIHDFKRFYGTTPSKSFT